VRLDELLDDMGLEEKAEDEEEDGVGGVGGAGAEEGPAGQSTSYNFL
jgi:hypothetical protein